MSDTSNNAFESILTVRRGFLSKYPANKKAVLVISGGLDSTIMAARLIEEHDMTIYPLHIERGQTNLESERRSLEHFNDFYKKRYGEKFNDIKYVKLNIPPVEFKKDIVPYMKKHGHPLRDTMLQLAAVQYAVSLIPAEGVIETVFCAVMPEDYFPHSSLESIRATNVAVCQNLDNWNWVISSPNIDSCLEQESIDKPTEIKWAYEHNIPVENTVSCNDSQASMQLLNCGTCSSCERRKTAFQEAGVTDKTKYFNKG